MISKISSPIPSQSPLSKGFKEPPQIKIGKKLAGKIHLTKSQELTPKSEAELLKYLQRNYKYQKTEKKHPNAYTRICKGCF